MQQEYHVDGAGGVLDRAVGFDGALPVDAGRLVQAALKNSNGDDVEKRRTVTATCRFNCNGRRHFRALFLCLLILLSWILKERALIKKMGLKASWAK